MQGGGLPTKNAYDSSSNGGQDVFVAKFDPDAATGPDSLVYSTYYGGSGTDAVNDIAVDAIGNLFLVGLTYSPNLPLQDEMDGTLDGTYDAFIAALGPTGSTLEYSSYFGGGGTDRAEGVALGPASAARNRHAHGR